MMKGNRLIRLMMAVALVFFLTFLAALIYDGVNNRRSQPADVVRT